jgi:hypothetical protein
MQFTVGVLFPNNNILLCSAEFTSGTEQFHGTKQIMNLHTPFNTTPFVQNYLSVFIGTQILRNL